MEIGRGTITSTKTRAIRTRTKTKTDSVQIDTKELINESDEIWQVLHGTAVPEGALKALLVSELSADLEWKSKYEAVQESERLAAKLLQEKEKEGDDKEDREDKDQDQGSNDKIPDGGWSKPSWLNLERAVPLTYDLVEMGKVMWEMVSEKCTDAKLHEHDVTVPMVQGKVPKGATDFLGWGGKPIDAILFFQKAKISCKFIEVAAPSPEDRTVRILAAQSSLGVFLMFVMVKGHWPSSRTIRLGADIPAFLANTMWMNYSPADLADRVASFSLAKLDPCFLKTLPFQNFGSAFVTRFFMGVDQDIDYQRHLRSIKPLLRMRCTTTHWIGYLTGLQKKCHGKCFL